MQDIQNRVQSFMVATQKRIDDSSNIHMEKLDHHKQFLQSHIKFAQNNLERDSNSISENRSNFKSHVDSICDNILMFAQVF
jgi:hypothetical protein